MSHEKIRCPWALVTNEKYINYHDLEWGVPVFDDQKLFEMLILEGAQAGLSWNTILQKRDNYKKAFDNFNVLSVANYNEKKIEQLLTNGGIVRNKRKIESAIKNAKVFITIQKEFGSFSNYLWRNIDFKPITNYYSEQKDVPTQTALSCEISSDLKIRGMNFVGPTILYSFMEAVGIVNDHLTSCFRHTECQKENKIKRIH